MGTVQQLLLYYGHGEQLFNSFIEEVEPGLRAGAVSPLCRIMQAQGSDKGLGHHDYTYLYHQLFTRFRCRPKNLFELGVGTTNPAVASNMGAGGVPGASLRGWREYFPEAAICGGDIDREVLFQEPRIQTLYVDQTNPNSIMSLWEHVPGEYDLIIDDGLHDFAANKAFLDGSKHKLGRDGFYIIEDIVMDINNIARFDLMLNAAVMSGFLYRLPHAANDYDNALVVLCGADFAVAGDPA